MEGVKGVGPGGPHDHASGPEQNSGPSPEQNSGLNPEQNSGPNQEQDGGPGRPKAENPADLARLFLDRANAGDVAGVVALYEADAVLAFPPGEITIGADAIWEVYEKFLSQRPTLTSAGQSEPLVNRDVALTSTRLPSGGATVEVARRQPDGTWLWAVDQPELSSRSW